MNLVFICWKGIIILIRSVTAISYVYLISLLLYNFNLFPFHLESNDSFGPSLRNFVFDPMHLMKSHPTMWFWVCIFTLWMVSEAVFYPFHEITLARLQLRRPCNHSMTSTERMHLVEKCLSALNAAHSDLRKVFEGWFMGAPFNSIYRGNFESWGAWAFFDKDLNELNDHESDELAQMTALAEKSLNHEFPIGFNPQLKCIRLTMDPVQVIHRPLIYYIVIAVINAFGHLAISYMGFNKRVIHGSDYTFFYRPAIKPSGKTEKNDSRPIVFIHGIGIGFTHYLNFLHSLPKTVPVYLLEWKHVSMQIEEKVPTIDETVEVLYMMLKSDRHEKACFIGHSLGTLAITWMIRQHPEMVDSTVLLDPVTFLLCDPSVAHNFIYRNPSTTWELLLHYFVAREMYIAHTLSRHFSWSRNIIFTEDLPPGGNTILLCGADIIVPAKAVRKYLSKTVNPESDVDVIYFEKQQHGEIMLNRSLLKIVAEKIRKRCGAPE